MKGEKNGGACPSESSCYVVSKVFWLVIVRGHWPKLKKNKNNIHALNMALIYINGIFHAIYHQVTDPS